MAEAGPEFISTYKCNKTKPIDAGHRENKEPQENMFYPSVLLDLAVSGTSLGIIMCTLNITCVSSVPPKSITEMTETEVYWWVISVRHKREESRTGQGEHWTMTQI